MLRDPQVQRDLASILAAIQQLHRALTMQRGDAVVFLVHDGFANFEASVENPVLIRSMR
jgi:hypothetical protein